MHFNIDEEMTALMPEPWDLKLTVGGVVRNVRPLEVADLQKLQYAEKMGEAYIRSLVADYFGEPVESIANVELMTLGGAIAAISGYQQARLSKHSNAIAAKVAAIAKAPPMSRS